MTQKKNLWQAAKFTLFSISAGLIQIASFAVFSECLHWSYWASYLPALVLSVLWNFTFNRRYTFRSDADVPRAMTLVFLYYLVFTPLTTWGGDALTRAGWQDWLVLGLTMLLNFVTEFLFQRFVVYRGKIDNNEVARRAQDKTEQPDA